MLSVAGTPDRILIAGMLLALCPATAQASDVGTSAFFEREIRPVLAGQCIKCHGPEKQKSSLRLDSRNAILSGGENGPAIVPGRPEESLLISAIRHEGLEMPPDKQLAEHTIRRFQEWVAIGAPWPEHEATVRESVGQISSSDRSWWAFQPLVKPEPPSEQDSGWAKTPVDRFVIRQLNEHGLTHAPAASRTDLIRRLYYDLIGLPPTPEEVTEFVADDDPQAWSNLIDRLLSDERHGEHWARFWLDLVRYSESDGWKQDAYRPEIWRYRDYVLKAFNSDKPWPEFVHEQLAGDEFSEGGIEALAAVGYLRLGIFEYNQRNAWRHWNDILDEVTDVTGDAFFGMSFACARCHDHKFDPLTQQDYYRLRAFFQPVIWRDDVPAATQQEIADHQHRQAKWHEATKHIHERVNELAKPWREKKWDWTVGRFPLDIQSCFRKAEAERNSWEHQMAYLVTRQFYEEGSGPLASLTGDDKEVYKQLEKQLAEFGELKPKPLSKLITVSNYPGPIAPTFIPGNRDAGPVLPAFPEVLFRVAGGGSAGTASTESSGEVQEHSTTHRSDLAEWITSPDNPLTTRVIVNRIWQQHFGRGLVDTPSDFGRLGTKPSHPELLDWLTTTFIEKGWSFKQLHRLILSSAVWQQSAHHPMAAQYRRVDPGERLLWSARVRRLTAEQIRDSMLYVSGELDSASGGPSVSVDEPRRSLYLKQYRNRTETFPRMFDAANGLKSVAVRDTTTTPVQSLLLLNGKWSLKRADFLADRLHSRSAVRPVAALNQATWLVWGRSPTERERRTGLAFLAGASRGTSAVSQERLADFCHVLLNSNEFLYVD